MLRKQMSNKGVGQKVHFRWRSEDVSRIEGFSDAVFGFAITLLIVSLEVPQTATELFDIMKGFVMFGACFTLLILIWHSHYTFFRRYGLQDTLTIVLNAALLFVVLFYIYPLKFMYTGLFNAMLKLSAEDIGVRADQGPILMNIYSIGFLLVFLIYVMLYFHAYRKRDELQLNEVECFDTLESIQYHGIYVLISLLSIAIASLGSLKYLPWAGMVYALLGPVQGLHGFLMGKRRERLIAARDLNP
jgi:uncharacterized membrane protein